jgi:murein DD-endopeptidase MepM/ murein hydrolase activator NlpD
LLYASRKERIEKQEGVSLTLTRKGRRERFRFFPGEDFSGTEKLFFLNDGFRFPLRTYRLTSAYGLRINPVTGRSGTHRGVDLAAPEGTPVYAAKGGIVCETGEDPIYGRYVIVSHSANLKSLYGHLSKIEAALNDKVETASVLGRVGSTGQSTGPHLHFEIRMNGKAQDPGKYLRVFQ